MANMALEITRGESYDIGLILENIALEIITGVVCTANVTISSDNFWTKCLCVRPLDVI